MALRRSAAMTRYSRLNSSIGLNGCVARPGDRRVQPAAGDDQQRKAGAGLFVMNADIAFFIERHGVSPRLCGYAYHPPRPAECVPAGMLSRNPQNFRKLFGIAGGWLVNLRSEFSDKFGRMARAQGPGRADRRRPRRAGRCRARRPPGPQRRCARQAWSCRCRLSD